MGKQPHVLAIPLPAQGHVGPLLKLATKIAEHGVKVTFVNTEFIEAKIMASMPEISAIGGSLIEFVSVPDGLEHGDIERDFEKSRNIMKKVMPGKLKELIEKINQVSDDQQISCVIGDVNAQWGLEVAQKLGIPSAAFVTYGPAILALQFHITKLIDDGVIDADGTALKDGLISISEGNLPWKFDEFPWMVRGQGKIQKIIFESSIEVVECVKMSNWVLSNSVYELDASSCDLVPNILPIGSLLASNNSRFLAGSFRPEDSSCLSWLDEKPIGSVVYVALGSSTILNQAQFDELAIGLESSGQSFLWVVRPDILWGPVAIFPDGFKKRIAGRGKIVEWAPQEKVLAHSSVACFVSHCGWNSTLEGLTMGVPFLCWPFFVDQYQNSRYICEAWKIGFELTRDDHGIVTRHEIQAKITKLFNEESIKGNALKLKEKATNSLAEGGSSYKNFQRFIAEIKFS
ncbi:UDP-glycosyltransferase 83A1-like [Mangifera indica]|uniref:UDP-glycosyltransferase 83A1-like n=1 Tax=Mangifera indica TaxID=29780 RepID=UPI001CFC2961|nr:UDP-glycosyltransferase 83A1-like [Mangifera indica]